MFVGNQAQRKSQVACFVTEDQEQLTGCKLDFEFIGDKTGFPPHATDTRYRWKNSKIDYVRVFLSSFCGLEYLLLSFFFNTKGGVCVFTWKVVCKKG